MKPYDTIKQHLTAHGHTFVTMYFKGVPTCMVRSTYFDNLLNRKVSKVHRISTKHDLLRWLS